MSASRIDFQRIDEAVLALMHLTLHDQRDGVARSWKGYDWDALSRLHSAGWIANPAGKARSVVLTDEGLRRSEELFRTMFLVEDEPERRQANDADETRTGDWACDESGMVPAERAIWHRSHETVAANPWLMAPSAAQKALAIFGSFRTAAASLASAFVFTVFRFSGNAFSAVTGGTLSDLRQASDAAAPIAISEARASALETQASAFRTFARRNAISTFGVFGEQSSFAANRSFGEAGGIVGGQVPATSGIPAFGMGGIDAARAACSLPLLRDRRPSVRYLNAKIDPASAFDADRVNPSSQATDGSHRSETPFGWPVPAGAASFF